LIVSKNHVVPLNFAAIMLAVSSLSLDACGPNPLLFSSGVVCLAHELVLDSKKNCDLENQFVLSSFGVEIQEFFCHSEIYQLHFMLNVMIYAKQ
jgi:hypothetical protein